MVGPLMGLRLYASGVSRQAPHHRHNEDAWVAYDEGNAPDRGRLYAVCDGVSTSGRGRRAARAACAALAQAVEPTAEARLAPGLPCLRGLVSESDWELRGVPRGGACTMSVVWFIDQRAVVLGVGDSPIVLLRKGKALPLHPVPPGLPPHFLGIAGDVSSYWQTQELEVFPGDVFLLMSDGGAEPLTDDDLIGDWARVRDPARLTSALMDRIARVGVDDDATILAVEVRRPAVERPTAPGEAPDPPAHLLGRRG